MKAFYKITGSLLALAVFPAAVFLPFFKLVVTSSVLSLFSSGTGEVLINDSYSFRELYDLILPYTDSFSGFSLASLPQNVIEAIKMPLIFFVGFLILIGITALALFVLCLFTKQNGAIILTSALGIGFTLGMNISFENLAKPLVNGTISVIDLLGQDIFDSILKGQGALAQIFGKLFNTSMLIDIRLLSLSSAYIGILLIFIVILCLAISRILINWK